MNKDALCTDLLSQFINLGRFSVNPCRDTYNQSMAQKFP